MIKALHKVYYSEKGLFDKEWTKKVALIESYTIQEAKDNFKLRMLFSPSDYKIHDVKPFHYKKKH